MIEFEETRHYIYNLLGFLHDNIIPTLFNQILILFSLKIRHL